MLSKKRLKIKQTGRQASRQADENKKNLEKTEVRDLLS